jgi:regulator of nonsense transcripts 1
MSSAFNGGVLDFAAGDAGYDLSGGQWGDLAAAADVAALQTTAALAAETGIDGLLGVKMTGDGIDVGDSHSIRSHLTGGSRLTFGTDMLATSSALNAGSSSSSAWDMNEVASALNESSNLRSVGAEGESAGPQPATESAPEHACSFCGIHNPACVVRCVSTGKWFCNTRGEGTASHIVQHLVRSKHKEVALHPESPLGDAVLECFVCGTRNCFLLGFIPAKTEKVVVLMCREPCLTLGALKDQGWDLSQWEPLIADRAFLPWLVPQPSEDEAQRARPISNGQIADLETLWRTRPEATFDDMLSGRVGDGDGGAGGAGAVFNPVLLRYEDGYEYQNIFGPLVKMEADEDKLLKENLKQEGLSVRWEQSLNKRWLARFHFNRPESDIRMVPGDEMRLKLPSFASQFKVLDALVAATRTSGKSADDDEGAWQARGWVRQVIEDEVVLELGGGASLEPDRMPSTGYTAEFIWRGGSFERMQEALKKFAVDDTSLSGYLYHALLGHSVEPQVLKVSLPADFTAPGLPELNPSQMAAVRTVLQRPLSLIQGA